MPDDAAWAEHVVIPDDLRELQADVDAYHREQRAARRARRWGWLTGSQVWQRWSFPLGVLTGAIGLAGLMFVLLAVESAPAHHQNLTPTSISSTAAAGPGERGGLLPDVTLTSTPDGMPGRTQPALGLRPALVALVPLNCRCTDVVAAIADQAGTVGAHVDVVAPAASDAEVSALPGQIENVQAWYDATATLASTYAADGVTVLVVDRDGVVSFVLKNTTAGSAKTLPVESLLVLPPTFSSHT